MPTGKVSDFELRSIQFYDEEIMTSFATDDRVEVRMFQVRKKSEDDMDVDEVSIADVPQEASKFKRLRKRH